MGMRIPGPADVLTISSLVQKGVTNALEDVSGIVDVVRRAGDVIGNTERMVRRMELLITRATDVLERVEDLVTDLDATSQRASEVVATAAAVTDTATLTTQRADDLITASVEVTGRAGQVVDQARQVNTRAIRVVDGAKGVFDRTDGLIGPWTDISDRMHPWASRISGSVQDVEVEAMVNVIDRMPRVAQHLDEDVVPLLGQLAHIRPDVREILQSLNDLNLAIKDMPDMSLLKRRGEKVDDEETKDDAQEPEGAGNDDA